MQRAQQIAALLSVSAILATSACRKQAAADDATTTAAVQSRLAADSALGAESIQSSVQTGVATLNGTVSSDAARVLAGNDAAQVQGIRTVINNLTVASAAIQPQGSTTPLSAPPVDVNTPPPSRVRALPVKPSAAIERQKIARIEPPQQLPPPPQPLPTPQPAPVERSAPQPAAPPAPTFRNVELSSGTTIPVRITQTLDSATTQQGERSSGTVASDVIVDGLVAIPQGSAVSGRVDAVQEAAHFKGNSLLTISLTSLSRRGERLPISTAAYSKEGSGRGKNTAEKTGVGAAAGAILGGIFGGGKGAAIGAAAGGGTGAGINGITRGQQVQIPSESLVSFRLSSSISVRVPLHQGDRSTDAHHDDPSSDLQRRPPE